MAAARVPRSEPAAGAEREEADEEDEEEGPREGRISRLSRVYREQSNGPRTKLWHLGGRIWPQNFHLARRTCLSPVLIARAFEFELDSDSECEFESHRIGTFRVGTDRSDRIGSDRLRSFRMGSDRVIAIMQARAFVYTQRRGRALSEHVSQQPVARSASLVQK